MASFPGTEGFTVDVTFEAEGAKMTDLARQLQGYRLTTAEILYHLPDHPKLLQSYIWQALDIAPRFPILGRFLDFWSRNLDGRLHSVKVCSAGLVKPAEVRLVGTELRLH